MADPIGDWDPNCDLPDAIKRLCVGDILAHESGLPAWRNFWINRISPSALQADMQSTGSLHIERVLERVDLTLGQLGTDLYSDVGMIIIGYLVAKIRQQRLEESFGQWLNSVVPVPSRGFFLGGPEQLVGKSVSSIPTSFCRLRQRLLQGEVHDENCFALGGFSGHAGLFGTGPSIGELLRAGYQQSSTFSEYLEENAKRLGVGRKSGLLGLRRGDDSGSLPFGAGRAMGHLGFTGTAFWLQPSKGIYGILLTNRVCSGRVSHVIQQFRAKVFELIEMIMQLRMN